MTYTEAVPEPVIAATLLASLTEKIYGVLAVRNTDDATNAVGAVPNSIKHAAVTVIITWLICVANADVSVAPLTVVADMHSPDR